MPASNGVLCAVNTSLEDEHQAENGGAGPSLDGDRLQWRQHRELLQNKSTFAWLREEYNRGVAIGGLCTGAHVLAAAGLLSGKRCAIHWENLPGFAETFPKANVFADLFEVDQNIYTCAGGTAALDMMLKLIGDDFDDALVNRVCEQVLTDRVRSPSDRQRLPLRARLGVQNSKVLTIIELMEANLSKPCRCSISPTMSACRGGRSNDYSARRWGTPRRATIWKFGSDRARHLLIQSSMPVVEVAVACGFVSASHFSKCLSRTLLALAATGAAGQEATAGGLRRPSPRVRGEGRHAASG